MKGAVLAQQTAANLHATPGDTVRVYRAGMPSYRVKVTGVVELPQADSLFQQVGAPTQSQPVAPPDNVLILPAQQFRQQYAGLARQRPDQVTTQVHAQRDHALLPHDPSSAFTEETGAANNLAVRTNGAGIVGNNLGASLDAAREDAGYARILFLFLGAPGALLAAALTAAIVESGAARRRREGALLRARGSRPGLLLVLVLVEAAVIGVLGGVLGLGIAWAVGAATSWAWDVGALFAGILIAGLVAGVPAARDLKAVAAGEEARSVSRSRPAWMRFGLDAVLIVTGLVVFWATGRNKYTLVLAPEGVPTISISYWAFLAPALAWLGCGLLCWRVADTMLRRERLVAFVARQVLGPLSETVAAMLMRQRRLVSRSVVLLALAFAFAFSTSAFNATYQQQAEVDAQLTNGADVTVTESPGANVPPSAAARLASVAGVKAVEPLQHRFAYVGNDLQDLYGINPTTLRRATTLQDPYFQGATADQEMARLASHPDGVLVSAETVNDFQLNPGDLIRLRLQDAHTHTYRTVPFHYVGIVNEFPTAPKDSFLVANATYVAQRTGSNTVGTFLVNTGGTNLSIVAAGIQQVVGTSATVGTINDARGVVGSSLTSVDLSRLTRLELAFALLIAAASAGLVVGLGLAERRRAIAVATGLGANRMQAMRFGLAEPAYVLLVGTICGLAAGWGLAFLLVKVLTGVFDPPPTGITTPWGYLLALVACATLGVGVVGTAVIERARRGARTLLRAI
jgi:putative ABC transport system permease protein